MPDAEAEPFLTGGIKPRPAYIREAQSAGRRAEGYLYTIPSIFFAVCVICFTFEYYHHPEEVCAVVLVCAALTFVFGIIGSEDQRHSTFLSLLCAIALVLGCMSGVANYSWHMEPYWFYEESRAYFNVLPSEPAAAHADAGRIQFAGVAHVDTTMSVGYRSEHLYCVAPVMDPYSGSRVEFWAVGVDCCQQRGKFGCDDALAENPLAQKGGLVVLDGGFLLQKNVAYYKKAVATAEASYDLISAPEPIFLRWVHDPVAMQDSLWYTGSAAVGALVCSYIVLNGLLAYVVNAILRKRRKEG